MNGKDQADGLLKTVKHIAKILSEINGYLNFLYKES